MSIAAEASVGHSHAANHAHAEVRNLLNRARLALGAAPSTLPSRDNPGVSKIAAMIYTERVGALDAIFDRAALRAMQDDGTLDGFGPKPVFVRGVVTDADRREYNGWAKIGCVLLTMEDDLDAINGDSTRTSIESSSASSSAASAGFCRSRSSMRTDPARPVCGQTAWTSRRKEVR